ncbi:hypothetical protein E2562_023669 [Oryza meyeriana var. granulata]|uniref:Protein kinase domain-containing protein n=1 Tax=Oryza meyeriana var. granulata TaxID=110450 RepID=A0A6G1BN16_9ORYZ|nr:hypothetical protein E2562_023669 [Oryza meyeriana var. granulata]
MAPRLLLLLAVVGSLVVAVVAGGDGGHGGSKILRPLKLSCSTDSNYTEGGQYHKNLDQLLSAIPMAAAGDHGFYNGTFGMAPDEGAHGDHAAVPGSPVMRALSTRRASSSSPTCPSSPSPATSHPASFYVQARRTRYGEYSPFGPPFVVDAAAMGSCHPSCSAGGRDLPASECTRCLSAARLPRIFPNNSAGAIKGYSCFVMYCVITRDPPLVQLLSKWDEQLPQQVDRALSSFGRPERRHRLPAVAAGGVAFVLCLSLSVWYLLHLRRRTAEAKAAIAESELEQPLKEAIHFRGRTVEDELEQGTGPRRFSYGELATATANFSGDNKFGEGGFRSVYRGVLTTMDDLPVAVKVSKSSRQGWKEFVSEVSIISRLRHRNLVQLIGWCHDQDGGDELLLVYELMPNGSLDGHIYSVDNVMPWPVRYEVVLGVGAALLYLHA